MTVQAVIIHTTSDKIEILEKIAEILIEHSFAACVTIIPSVQSVYRWNNRIEKNSEHILEIKTIDSLVKKIENQVQRLHNHECPQFIVTPIISMSESYRQWYFGAING